MHNFNADLQESNSPENNRWWNSFYPTYFTTLSGTIWIDSLTTQKAGADRIIVLKNRKKIYIEEKLRDKDYKDILLEYQSTERDPGWVEKDLWCDYLAYGIKPTNTVYMLPWVPLRKAWIANKTEWLKWCKTQSSPNYGYVSKSVVIPIRMLLEAIEKQISCTFKMTC